MQNFPYWQKQSSQPLFPDLLWNIPEQKIGHVNIIGGNSQSFANCVKIFEYFNRSFPVKQLNLILPDTLRSNLPTSPQLYFAPATNSGSFATSPELTNFFTTPDFTFLAGDLSKNSATCIAITDAIKSSSNPILITRDGVDLITPEISSIIDHSPLFLVASMSQLQKLFRAILYPRMILLSTPIFSVIETLHKFTLSYPSVTILTFHQNQILVASSGNIITTPIENTTYSPLSLWSGILASKITALNLFNPHQPLKATASAILYD